MIKPRPEPDLRFLFHPEADTAYAHFADAGSYPFEPRDPSVGRRNAWWLAEASLLAYWDVDAAVERFAAPGLLTELVEARGTQAYLAIGDGFVLVAFRGTEIDAWEDAWVDAQAIVIPWDGRSGGSVHAGFRFAIDAVWPTLGPRLMQLAGRRAVWFTGHSLGGALATLAADRFASTAGLATFGSPRVGDHTFAARFSKHHSNRAVRYVSGVDLVPHLPPPGRYVHVGWLRQIAADGTVSAQPSKLLHYVRDLFGDPAAALETARLLGAVPPRFLTGHIPRGYAVDCWNDYARNG